MKMRGAILFLMLALMVQACATSPDQGRREGGVRPPPKPTLSSDQTTTVERIHRSFLKP